VLYCYFVMLHFLLFLLLFLFILTTKKKIFSPNRNADNTCLGYGGLSLTSYINSRVLSHGAEDPNFFYFLCFYIIFSIPARLTAIPRGHGFNYLKPIFGSLVAPSRTDIVYRKKYIKLSVLWLVSKTSGFQPCLSSGEL